MSLGSWDPDAQAAADSASIDPETLQRFIAWGSIDSVAALEDAIGDADSQSLSAFIRLEHDEWLRAVQDLDDDALRQLIRFFALAENLPGWEAGERSAVIPLAKVLRKRGARLQRDFLLWLREINENRYLPYGPL